MPSTSLGARSKLSMLRAPQQGGTLGWLGLAAGLSVAHVPVRGAAADWPSLPQNEREAGALVQRYRRNSLGGEDGPPRDARVLLSKLQQAIARDEAIGGWSAIRSWLRDRAGQADASGRRLVVLWGVHHDAGGQLRAFRRLVLSGEAHPVGLVALEQLDADGRWRGIDRARQRGDDHVLARFAAGHRDAFRALAARQEQLNYTAWKYDHLEDVLDIVAAARAHAVALSGCDMPSTLRERLSALSPAARLRLRELHCLLHLEEQTSPGRQAAVAMVWGQQHLSRRAVPGFLGPRDELIAIYVFGERSGPYGLERDLGLALAIGPPLLVPLGGPSHAVLLPDARLGAVLERARQEGVVPPALKKRAMIGSAAPFAILSGGQRWEGRRTAALEVRRASGLVYMARSRGRTLVGLAKPPAGGTQRVDLDFQARAIRETFTAPKRAR